MRSPGLDSPTGLRSDLAARGLSRERIGRRCDRPGGDKQKRERAESEKGGGGKRGGGGPSREKGGGGGSRQREKRDGYISRLSRGRGMDGPCLRFYFLRKRRNGDRWTGSQYWSVYSLFCGGACVHPCVRVFPIGLLWFT